MLFIWRINLSPYRSAAIIFLHSFFIAIFTAICQRVKIKKVSRAKFGEHVVNHIWSRCSLSLSLILINRRMCYIKTATMSFAHQTVQLCKCVYVCVWFYLNHVFFINVCVLQSHTHTHTQTAQYENRAQVWSVHFYSCVITNGSIK